MPGNKEVQGVDLECLSPSILQCQRDGPLPADWWQHHRAEVARGICFWLFRFCSHSVGGAQEPHTLFFVTATRMDAVQFGSPYRQIFFSKHGQPKVLVHTLLSLHGNSASLLFFS